ncbi:ligase-associated DNA damage response exonuclease [Sinorhizobium numidicum]|uniref:Ligase-associated DNA damage response exonuclease n=1 Tax=Sinorhizobium numidicum TaxID=680248 RepID=A0ABY8D044_9HYPH|nr:ligase-associated DNA damage response exonuclease [Sinorhizobium numidicum]WEX77093.1 ligase-associated DNA damage response exonuclease [Sinorhizobium numidicum]WEX83752.1 ligase-associated DNA damage response exonuclease [Sinorhizobium numidicum]
MKPDELLYPAPKGLYCAKGDFYIDPVQPVERALITHGHSDHARAGHGHVLATRETLDIMRVRYGDPFCGASQIASFGETIAINEARIRFHPAGHVLGSAQISVEAYGTRVVVSGDYKRRPDPTCTPFEPVLCDVFITEATFGLPVFHHPNDEREINRLLLSLKQFPERSHVVGAYALGKAQRLIALLRRQGYDAPVHIHGALAKLCEYYQGQGIDLGEIRPATLGRESRQDFAGAIIIGPPSAFADRWARRFADPLAVFASGWMLIRQRAKQRGVELPLVISDHCDWAELTQTIKEITPSEVWVTHGREEALVRWCELQGIPARPLHLVGYDDEGE